MKPRLRLLSAVLLPALLVAPLAAAPAPKLFTEGVRATEPLSPEEQRLKFHLPPGFKIQLVASEPDLRKPMNMAFDSAGRLWVTESREYPFAATNAALARDTIRIFSDFDDHGRARKVTTFATNLNIPIGIYPFRSPAKSPIANRQSAMTWKCIAWSIPNIYLFEDTDGDGVADQQEKLYGPFDHTRDTHGNQASFRRGLDGWIYATHGFNNQSRVSGTDGHEIFLPSGNVYRFRLDGSRIEHWTHGQVNPFGLTFDPLGNLYSADCHSSPIYQLLRGAHYPSFGRPHDGLGFAPTTIQHSHHSTAICGIVHISDPAWPAEFQGNLFIGNVMTSRINRDRLEWRGSTSVGHEMPDFLSTDDPWFRPVDLQFGPDGALWVADFYNRIIGHYEVPLLHPGRDRERGRIWRIVPPVGADVRRLKLNTDTTEQLIAELASANPTCRNLALNELCDTKGKSAGQAVFNALLTRGKDSGDFHVLKSGLNTNQQVNLLWASHRIDNMAGGVLAHVVALALNGLEHSRTDFKPAANPVSVALRVHAMRISSELGLELATDPKKYRVGSSGPTPAATECNFLLLKDSEPLLKDTNAFVLRALVEAISADAMSKGHFFGSDNLGVPALLELFKRVPPEDTHLRHAMKLTLRNVVTPLVSHPDFGVNLKLEESQSRLLAELSVAITNEGAASFLLRHIQAHTEPADVLARYVTHAARYAPDADLPKLASLGRKQFAADLDTQAALFKSMQEGLATRGGALPADLRSWGTDLAAQLLGNAAPTATWTYVPLPPAAGAPSIARPDGQPAPSTPSNARRSEPPAAPGRNPFAFEERTSADGQKTRLMSSFPHGETLTGILRSPVFVLPKQLSFYLCGHDGFPGQPAGGKNHVRLRLVKDTEKAKVICVSPPAPNPDPNPVPSPKDSDAVLPHPDPLPLGEGTRPAALGSGQPVLASEGPALSPRRPASLLLPAGEGRDEGEWPPLQLADSCLQAAEQFLHMPDNFLRVGEPLLRLGGVFLPVKEQFLRGPVALLHCRNDILSHRNEFQSRRGDFSGHRNDSGSRRNTTEWRRNEISGQECAIGSHLTEAGGRWEAGGMYLAAAPAAGALPEGVIREAKVPRNDTAQRITWNLADLAGKRAVIEVTDGDDGKAYAWLAFGRFDPALPELALHDTQGVGKRQLAGAELARSLKLAALEPAVTKLFNDSTDAAVRAAAGRAWLSLNAVAALPKVEPLVRDAAQPENLRAELAAQLGEQADARGLAVVVAALTNAPSRLQLRFATALVSTAAGTEQLLAAAEAGRVPARLLQDRTLTDRLRASPARDARNRHAALVKNLPPADAQLQKLIEAKRAEFKPQQASASRGAEVFTKACAVCHQLDGKGTLVGPQLDGIGGRGLERLLEDILDPNRNVDKAFRTTVYVLKDGETVSGLARREEGGAFIYALPNGQEARVPKADVNERRDTETSLMPANFHEALTPTELNDLLAFLLGKTGK
jgi:putative heme-binding domain-containing protein